MEPVKGSPGLIISELLGNSYISLYIRQEIKISVCEWSQWKAAQG